MSSTNPPLNPYNIENIFNVYTDTDNTQFYNLYNTVTIDSDIDNTLYTSYVWSQGDSWYTISYNFYKTTYLWWIILLANQVINPFDDIKPGTTIKILNSQTVSNILNTITLSKLNN